MCMYHLLKATEVESNLLKSAIKANATFMDIGCEAVVFTSWVSLCLLEAVIESFVKPA